MNKLFQKLINGSFVSFLLRWLMLLKHIRSNFSIMIFLSLVSSISFAGDRPYMAVIQKVAGSVGFYSEDGKNIAQVKVGNFPHEAVLSKDGRYLYVSDNGMLWMTDKGNGGNTISIIDIHAMKKTGEIKLGRFHRPHGIALVPGTNYLLATTENPYGLVMIDLSSKKVVRDYDVKGKGPHMVMLTHNGKWAFVSNTDSNTVAAIELKSGKVNLIPTGARPQGGVVSPDGKSLYIVNTGGNQISIIDIKKQEVVGSIETGKGPGRITITPDGKTLVYNLQFEPGVGFADIKSRKQTTVIPLSGRPLSLTMTPDGSRAFAGIQDQDKVCFISINEKKIEQIIELPKGSGPDPVISLNRR